MADTPECSICLCVCNTIDDALTTCGHHFHNTCIDKWTQEHDTCPICRTTPVKLVYKDVISHPKPKPKPSSTIDDDTPYYIHPFPGIYQHDTHYYINPFPYANQHDTSNIVRHSFAPCPDLHPTGSVDFSRPNTLYMTNGLMGLNFAF